MRPWLVGDGERPEFTLGSLMIHIDLLTTCARGGETEDVGPHIGPGKGAREEVRSSKKPPMTTDRISMHLSDEIDPERSWDV